MEAANIQLRAALADEVLERVKACPPAFFEQLVLQLLIRMGYGGSREEAGRAVGRSGDGGIDSVLMPFTCRPSAGRVLWAGRKS
jgi:restriction system protein